ncbi:hypothetical protein PC116_g33717 [Phytophthora cactorum]|nr:hypothetical protein PC116_g33717 [Phytophthora cactorum]
MGNGNPSTLGFSPTTNPGVKSGAESRNGGGSNTQEPETRFTGDGSNENSSPSNLGSSPTSNPSANGAATPHGQSMGTQLSPSTGTSFVLTTSSWNINPAPTKISGGEAQPTVSDSSTGSLRSNPETANTQTPSFTFPPGVVPYGGSRTPSMTTLASMIAWTEPDGEKGPTTMGKGNVI